MSIEEKKLTSVNSVPQPSIGVAIIAKNAEKSIKNCIESFIESVDQVVVVLGGESTDKTEGIVRSMKGVEVYPFEWCDDFSAARNFSFSKLKTDFLLWVDGDDVIYQAEKLREIIDGGCTIKSLTSDKRAKCIALSTSLNVK